MSRVAINIHIQVFLWSYIFLTLGHIHENEIAFLNTMCLATCSSQIDFQTVLGKHRGCDILDTHRRPLNLLK